ncbi:MAG: ssDNA exonuclease RecJ [Methanosaeta sp. PtaB.Bin039]|nr:MAG: ssDNA exonuclease RecJ [Methanosaeta sp. PtaB.Bin039]OPY47606.1 MAG: ssDNA exonuclease RecJ [Methanosaeta sp. PtaU1.Bin028]HOT06889.1 DHH family phosphoesterase [Methanotrichaceae archaeon]HQF16489.1 DHH family phosphoesterase [Methanotrichaceae archaeon]HQI91912.1 DHH family phosphoesterase [Methanotrichaceae archaeon]
MNTEEQTYDGLIKACLGAREAILASREAVVVSHVDADGLSSAAIMCTALGRIGIDANPVFFKQLDGSALRSIADLNPNLTIFTDLGSGMIGEISELDIPAVVADHHRPSQAGKHSQIAHINPHLAGGDGSIQISGAGCAYLLARSLSPANKDLAQLAVVGAVGDLQDQSQRRLVGLNRRILSDAQEAGLLAFGPDIRLFGRQTRPVWKMLEYCQDPFLPGLSGDEEACIAFLKELGIRLGGERWRRWIDLDQGEKSRVASALMRHGLRAGLASQRLERLVGEVYTLLLEREGTELRDATEYSTLLNATARYGHSRIGLAVLMGDRDQAFEDAQRLLGQHRQNLVNGIKLVREVGITPMQRVQFFDAGSAITDTIVGIVAGLCFQMADRSKPLLAFADTPDGCLKVSARGTMELVHVGLDLSSAISRSAQAVGGVGGGHNVAAGATIPPHKKMEFLELMDRAIDAQMPRQAKPG